MFVLNRWCECSLPIKCGCVWGGMGGWLCVCVWTSIKILLYTQPRRTLLWMVIAWTVSILISSIMPSVNILISSMMASAFQISRLPRRCCGQCDVISGEWGGQEGHQAVPESVCVFGTTPPGAQQSGHTGPVSASPPLLCTTECHHLSHGQPPHSE